MTQSEFDLIVRLVLPRIAVFVQIGGEASLAGVELGHAQKSGARHARPRGPICGRSLSGTTRRFFQLAVIRRRFRLPCKGALPARVLLCAKSCSEIAAHSYGP